MKNKHRENYLKVILGLCAMTFMIYIATTVFKRARIDFTEEGLYTLSEGTLAILSKLDSPIKLKLYYSKTAANKGTEGLRSFNNHYSYVSELLRQYVGNSRNNLSLKVIDPRPDTPEEEDAMVYGLKKFHLTETEKYFFGLVAQSESGSEKIIEFFDPGQKDKLEYQITKLIYTVLNPQKKNIGIISSINGVLTNDVSPYMAQIMRMQGKSVSQSWLVTRMLREFYNLKEIKKDAETISGIDVLVVIHPKGFGEKTLLAIDQYVLGGGNLLVFVDPNAVSDEGMLAGRGRMGSSFSPDPAFGQLMAKWGIGTKLNTFAGDKYLSGMGRLGVNRPVGRLLALLNCNEKCTESYNDTITAGINTATFIFPGVLTKTAIEGVRHFPIMSTTAKGNSYSAFGYEMNNPEMLWNKFKDGDKPVVIAYKAVGKFKTAFPDKKPADGQDKLLADSLKESAIVVFADVDFIADRFAFRDTFLGPAVANGNSTLFVNSVEALAGDLNLMSVRSKGRINRSFDVISKIEFDAEKRTAGKVKEINASISRFQGELSRLGQKAREGNIAILQNEGIRKKKELAKKIAVLKKELRLVKRKGREKIERIGKFFQILNTLLVPIVIAGLGIYYNRKRARLVRGKPTGKLALTETKA